MRSCPIRVIRFALGAAWPLGAAALHGFPLKTDSAEVLAPGEFEVTGAFEYERAGDARTTTMEPEIEFGLLRGVHLELEAEREVEREAGTRERTLEFALKSRIALPALSETVALALQPSLARAATRAPGERSYATELGLRALITRTLGDVQWHFNLGYSRDAGDAREDDMFIGGAFSRRVSANFKVQGELYTRFAPRGGGREQWVANVAGKQKLTDAFSLVARIGAGLNRHSPDFIGLIGFEWEP